MAETTEQYRTRINQLKTGIENEPYIKKMRENIAEGISKTGNRQADIEEQFQEVIDNTTGKDVISAPELIAARNGEANLKARLDIEQQQINAQLTQTKQEAERKRELEDLSPEVLSAIQGGEGTQFNLESIPQDKSVTYSKLNFDVVIGNKSKNLFNKREAIIGKYAASNSGQTFDNPDYFTTKLIGVHPDNGNIFVNANDQYYFKDSSGAYISGGTSSGTSIPIPSNARLFGFSAPINKLDALQIEYGDVGTEYANFGGLLPEKSVENRHIKPKSLSFDVFNKDVLDYVKETNPKTIGMLGEELLQPNKRSNIKFIGDSIVAGVGGTGYSPTGEEIGGTFFETTQYANVDSAVSMPNFMKKFVSEQLPLESYPMMNNPIFKYERPYNIQTNVSNVSTTRLELPNNVTVRKAFSFVFYGDTLVIRYFRGSYAGIAEIDVDGNKYLMDCTIERENNEFVISGLSESEHNVSIYETTKTNGTGQIVFIEGIKFKKQTRVKNWGVSGINSYAVYQNIDKLVEEDDDVIFIEIGTNDRIDYSNTRRTIQYLTHCVDYIIGLGKHPVLMIAPPVPNETYTLNMQSIALAIKQVSDEKNVPCVNNYQTFVDYEIYTGSYETLLSDGLHPNDLGYKIMYRNLMKEMRLPVNAEVY